MRLGSGLVLVRLVVNASAAYDQHCDDDSGVVR